MSSWDERKGWLCGKNISHPGPPPVHLVPWHKVACLTQGHLLNQVLWHKVACCTQGHLLNQVQTHCLLARSLTCSCLANDLSRSWPNLSRQFTSAVRDLLVLFNKESLRKTSSTSSVQLFGGVFRFFSRILSALFLTPYSIQRPGSIGGVQSLKLGQDCTLA